MSDGGREWEGKGWVRVEARWKKEWVEKVRRDESIKGRKECKEEGGKDEEIEE